MKTVNASRPFSREASISRFEAAKAHAFSIAKSGNEMFCRAGGLACVTPDEWTSKLT